jgi:Ca2+-binding RTX toxin-like protein
MAFQALAVIGAQTAAAAVSCTFAGGVVSITADADADAVTAQQQSNGQIFFNGSSALCGPTVLTSNTTAISITGGTGDQTVTIDMFDETNVLVSWGAINWTISLGADGAAGDSLVVTNAAATDAGMKLVAGASGIDLNNDADLDVTLAGVENFTFTGSTVKADTISAAGSTATGAAFATKVTINGGAGAGDNTLTGGAGADTITGGTGDDTVAGGAGDDALNGGAGGEDTVDYSSSTAAVTVSLTTNVATGQGLDTLTAGTFDDIIGSPQGDTLTGSATDNVITPGAGDDKVDGKGAGADDDTVDYSDATAAVTVDLDAGTATGGSGNDTLTDIESAQGSDFADTLNGNDTFNGLFGGAGNDTIAGMAGDDDLEGEGGVDVVDYSWSASPVTVLLSCDTATAGDGDIGGTTNPTNDDLFTIENAILTADDDSFTGNQFSNRVWPNGGQNSLDGDSGKTCTTTPGGDTLDYSVGYTTGVNVNMAGGATAGDSAINFENAIGTAFRDTIVGNASSNTVQGRAGKDNLKGGSGDDVLRGAKGNDIVRGGSGDDDMFGGPGKKDRGFGGSGTDLCKGFEFRRGCELR